MIPQEGQVVIVYFRTGAHLEGEVISWSDGKSVLKSTTGTWTLVIQKTLDDVMFYKYTSAPTEYEKLKAKPHKDHDDIKTLAALKDDLREIEREEIREKLTSHEPSGTLSAPYDPRRASYDLILKQGNQNNVIPGNIPIRSPQRNTEKEVGRTSSQFGSELQNLFGKKD